jgi:hypothetical protein
VVGFAIQFSVKFVCPPYPQTGVLGAFLLVGFGEARAIGWRYDGRAKPTLVTTYRSKDGNATLRVSGHPFRGQEPEDLRPFAERRPMNLAVFADR